MNRIDQVSLHKQHSVLNVMPAGVTSSHFQGCRRDVHGRDKSVWEINGARHGKHPAPCPKVQHCHLSRAIVGSQKTVHKELRLRSGNEHSRGHLEVNPVKFFYPYEIGNWFAMKPTP